jgi:hypothetical protein
MGRWTGMKILDLLEGTIKVPQAAMTDLLGIVYSDVLSRILSYLEQDESEESFELSRTWERMGKGFARQFPNTFHIYSIDAKQVSNGAFYVRKSEIDPRYLSRNKNMQDSYRVNVMVELANLSGEYYKKSTGKPAKIVIRIGDADSLYQVARNPEMFDSYIDRVEGVAEHELQHAIQDMAFKQIPNELAYYDKDKNLDMDKYHVSDIEFSPLITSEAKEFISYAKDVKASGWEMTGERKKDLFMNFVNPTAQAPKGLTPNTSNFFSSLYRQDRAKWQKAVKLLHSLVNGKI